MIECNNSAFFNVQIEHENVEFLLMGSVTVGLALEFLMIECFEQLRHCQINVLSFSILVL